MAASDSRLGSRRRWVLVLCLVAALAIAGLGTLLWQTVELLSLATVSHQVNRLKPLAGALRLALIVSVAALWPRFSTLCQGPGANDDEVARSRWAALRWPVVGWLLVLELVIGQSLIGRIVGAAAGG